MKRWLWAIVIGFQVTFAYPSAAADVQARLDREEISQDESVELKIQVESDRQPEVGEIQYQAPGLELVNQYQGVQSHFSSYNGVMSRGVTVSITHVLRPTRNGTLKITGIRVPVDGTWTSVPDLIVRVLPPGSRTHVGGPGSALRGGVASPGGEVFITTDVSKEQLYKGEQIIVSYYLYAQVRVADQAPEKYPELTGFLKEELEMPFMQGRPIPERVSRGGRQYDRYLVAKYAAYPIQTGKLKIDGLALKYTYLPRVDQDFDDPFSIQGFFQGIAPRTASVHGKDVFVEVLPLPEAGKPGTFTGGVGDFSVSAATDKDHLKVNEALTLKIKVEGRGNLAAMGEPRVNWPSGLEVYDTQGKSSVGRGGVGDKIFDVVLIPKTAGVQVIPAIELSFFDPVQKKYYTRASAPISITVEPGVPGSEPVISPKNSPASAATSETSSGWLRRIAMGFGLLAALLLIAALVWGLRLLKRDTRSEAAKSEHAQKTPQDVTRDQFWSELRGQLPAVGAPVTPAELEAAYAQLEQVVTRALKRLTDLDLRSASRDEVYLRAALTPETETDLRAVSEYSEALRYAARAGAVRYEDARSAWPEWRSKVFNALNVLSKLDQKK